MNISASDTGNNTHLTQLLARYERLIEISHQLNTTFDQPNLLKMIISAAAELTNTEAASILLIDPASGELRFEQATNINSNHLNDITVPMEGSIAGWVVTYGEARVIEDVTQEPQFFPNVDETISFRTRNILAVPLRTHNKTIGVLEAVNKNNDSSFNDGDIKTLTILAGQAAIAIENTRLFQQSDFMSEMVHELRTPLAALKTSTVLLMRPDLPEDRKYSMLRIMQSETDRLIRMTSEFLDLARWESGRARLDITEFDIAQLVNESIDIVQPQAEENNIHLQSSVPDDVVKGDRGKLKQVVLNLLTNAIKYNRPGGAVEVTARQTANSTIISITDNGYGISKEAQKNMFQKFYRVADTAGQTQGTGLGLAITRYIIEAHNGEIWLESEQDIGSTFSFSLPH